MKAQKQDIIQNGKIFGILYPFLYSTQYCSHIMDSLWNVGMEGKNYICTLVCKMFVYAFLLWSYMYE